jgi:hypothetical protein
MSTLYELNLENHNLVNQLAEQEGFEILIQPSGKWIYKKEPFSFEWKRQVFKKTDDYIITFEPYNEPENQPLVLIETPEQIYQILVAFEEVLGKKTSKALWNKWSEYKTGAFHRGDEGMIEVLEELNQILKSKIK